MSRVGKNPVKVPSGVTVHTVNDNLVVKGKLGELSLPLSSNTSVVFENDEITVTPLSEDKFARMMWGTMRNRIANMVTGVSTGFSQNLEILGVGYRAQVQGQNLVLQLGYSHDIVYPIPVGITIVSEKPTAITVKGIDKQVVGAVVAKIKSYRPPEPYKGKGIRKEGEYVRRKEGKKK
ncbi:MAG: 50S ribosomal protein L6 [Alphaproteobacteria bacterium]|nr:50S ribosomal protein L6 [Alphaproteobacteria bacterium]